MTQPPGCVVPGKEHLVCKLSRSLYGLRQSPRAWYSRIDAFLRKRGLRRSFADANVYFSHSPPLYLVLYVDDLFITGPDATHISALQLTLAVEFEMKDLGIMRKFLGIEVLQTPTGIFLHQSAYNAQLLARYSSSSLPPSSIPISPSTRLSIDTATPPIDSQAYQALVG